MVGGYRPCMHASISILNERSSHRISHLLHAALVHALLANELHLQRPAYGHTSILDLQQRVVHKVLPSPHLEVDRSGPHRVQRRRAGIQP